ncbi:uncharacterized protein [Amphiura filiformis]|uniref:uncharacterized protein n=1 Tax=Amphiura filiformis TaxID=82378 RepID=UPI003B21C768
MHTNCCTFNRFLQLGLLVTAVICSFTIGTPVEPNARDDSTSQVSEETSQQQQQLFHSQWEGCPGECSHVTNLFCSQRRCLECQMYCLPEETYYSVTNCQTNCPAYFASLQTTEPLKEETHSVSDARTKNMTDVTEPPSITKQIRRTEALVVPSTERLIGTPRLQHGPAWIIAVVIAFVVFILGLAICYRGTRKLQEEDKCEHEQTAKLAHQKNTLNRIKNLDLCGILNGNDDRNRARGVYPENDARHTSEAFV